MKTLFLLFCLPVLSLSGLFAQVNAYQPFPVDGGVWKYKQTHYCMPGFAQYEITIKSEGDTIISAKTYKKLKTIASTRVAGTVGCYGDVTQYWGAIRQDLLNKKVYIKPVNQNSEVVLYDFNLEVGDTLPGYLCRQPLTDYSPVVYAIDTVEVGQSRRKRWTLGYIITIGGIIQIVEGIGAIQGLTRLANFMVDSPLNPEFSFICIDNTGTGECDIVLNAKENISPKQIDVYPNPFSGQFQISGLDGEASQIIIRDIQGKTLETRPASNTEKFSAYGPGLYFLEIQMKTRPSVVKRLVGIR